MCESSISREATTIHKGKYNIGHKVVIKDGADAPITTDKDLGLDIEAVLIRHRVVAEFSAVVAQAPISPPYFFARTTCLLRLCGRYCQTIHQFGIIFVKGVKL